MGDDYALFEAEYPEGLGYVARLLVRFSGVDRHTAMEISQDSWGRAWEQRSQFRGVCRLRVWVGSIAINQFRGRLRRFSKVQSHAPDLGIDHHDRRIHDSVLASQVMSSVRRDAALVLEQAYMLGISTKVMAGLYGISEGGMRVKIMRARIEAKRGLK